MPVIQKRMELKIPPAALALVFSVIMWLVARVMPVADIALEYRLGAGAALAAAGFIIALAGIITFRRAGTTIHPTRPHTASALVTTGIYRHTRNPMYLGILLGLSGWGVFLASLPALFVLPLFVAYMTRFQILPEERSMTALFGAEFTAYSRDVRRWI